MTPTSLKEEFEKAFYGYWETYEAGSYELLPKQIALWAANWAFSKAAEECDLKVKEHAGTSVGNCVPILEVKDKLRQLSKELEGE